jgi:hypothetical protein
MFYCSPIIALNCLYVRLFLSSCILRVCWFLNFQDPNLIVTYVFPDYLSSHYLNHGASNWVAPNTPLSGPFFDTHGDNSNADFSVFGSSVLSPMQLSSNLYGLNSPPVMHPSNKNYPTSRDWSPLKHHSHEDFGINEEFAFSDLTSPQPHGLLHADEGHWSSGIAGSSSFSASQSGGNGGRKNSTK